MLGEVALAFFNFKGPYEKRKEFSEAANSLIARYDLLNKKIPCKNQLRSFMKSSTSSSVVPIKNPLFQNDLFGPMEENIRTAPTGTFVSMKEFGVSEKDVFFVDNTKDSNFTMAKNTLENSEIVKILKINKIILFQIGLDSEFTSFSGAEKQRVAIFQISNSKNAFIFDMDKIGNNPEFQDLFLGILINPKITKVNENLTLKQLILVKVGNSIASDLQMLNQDFKNLVQKATSPMQSYIEISDLAQACAPVPEKKTYSLVNLVERCFNSKTIKF